MKKQKKPKSTNELKVIVHNKPTPEEAAEKIKKICKKIEEIYS